MKIRVATINDAETIAEIHTISWRETYQNALTEQYLRDVVPKDRALVWRERLDNPKHNQRVFVAVCDGVVVGFICLLAGENIDMGSFLDNLHVLKTHQSKGIGKALLKAGARWCLQQEPTKGLCLLVIQDNSQAQKFYKQLGATNTQAGVWNAPDGSLVPTYWFVWSDIKDLLDND